MKNLSSLFYTNKNNYKFDVKIDNDFNYYLFINNNFIKKYKYKKALLNYVSYNYDVNLIF